MKHIAGWRIRPYTESTLVVLCSMSSCIPIDNALKFDIWESIDPYVDDYKQIRTYALILFLVFSCMIRGKSYNYLLLCGLLESKTEVYNKAMNGDGIWNPWRNQRYWDNRNRSRRVHQTLSGTYLRERALAENEGYINCAACRRYNLWSRDTLVWSAQHRPQGFQD